MQGVIGCLGREVGCSMRAGTLFIRLGIWDAKETVWLGNLRVMWISDTIGPLKGDDETATHFCTHTHKASSTRFEQRVKRRYVGHARDWQLVAKRSSVPLKKHRPAAMHLLNSVLALVD